MKLRNALLLLPICLYLPWHQDAAIYVNGDGNYSFPELQVAMTDMTIDDFTLLDGNGDGLLDADEITAGVEAELLPMMDG